MIEIGHGAFGAVYADKDKGRAIKHFDKIPYLIQEYAALKYLRDCNFVVKPINVNLATMDLYMDLYDGNLKDWINKNRDTNPEFKPKLMSLIKDILYGLIELHDRNLIHGDIKPNNILIRSRPLKAVLGDCGFVTISKYVPVHKTCAVYRDPTLNNTLHMSHDVFSLGVCLYDILTGNRVLQQLTYAQLRKMVRDDMTDSKQRDLVLRMISENKSERPSVRQILKELFNETLPVPVLNFPSISYEYEKLPDNQKRVYNRFVDYHTQYNLARNRAGFQIFLHCVSRFNLTPSQYEIYIRAIAIILTSCFGDALNSKIPRRLIIKQLIDNQSKSDIQRAMTLILNDLTSIDLLFRCHKD